MNSVGLAALANNLIIHVLVCIAANLLKLKHVRECPPPVVTVMLAVNFEAVDIPSLILIETVELCCLHDMK